jgi:hypothetical protein
MTIIIPEGVGERFLVKEVRASSPQHAATAHVFLNDIETSLPAFYARWKIARLCKIIFPLKSACYAMHQNVPLLYPFCMPFVPPLYPLCTPERPKIARNNFHIGVRKLTRTNPSCSDSIGASRDLDFKKPKPLDSPVKPGNDGERPKE